MDCVLQLKNFFFVCLFQLLHAQLLCQRALASPPSLWNASSQIISLNENWLFGKEYITGSEQAGFDDSDFLNITIPHVVTPLNWNQWSPANWEKEWIYRRHFGMPGNSSGVRMFLDFEAVLTGATPTLNGVELSQHLGGYLPFSYEVTELLKPGNNILAVKVDARWLSVNPEGSPEGPASIDYLEPGGIHRGISLRLVPMVFISDVFAKPVRVLDSSPAVNATITLDHSPPHNDLFDVLAELRDGSRILQSATHAIRPVPGTNQTILSFEVPAVSGIELWSPDNPKLYDFLVTLLQNGTAIHSFVRRIGFRQAVFELDGFYLNGKRLQIFGLNRHEIFPYGGLSISARLQRRDAQILKELNCNMVRCSHYPQSPHFLDACDELGLLVWEEIPGWQYIGNTTWQAHVVSDVHDMIIRDRSRPSIIIWGTQVNESPREPALYTETKALAYSLDGSRQVSGANTNQNLLNWVADVFAYDDYNQVNGNATLLPPVSGVPYLVSESIGELDGLKFFRWIDAQYFQQGQCRLHAEVHDIAGANPAYSGLLGWSAFDYASLQGNIYENTKWPGVIDFFRIRKPGAAFYFAQQKPQKRVVIEPAFYWDFSPTSPVSNLGSTATIWSNCERLEAYVGGSHFASLIPERDDYPTLAYPPFYLDTNSLNTSDAPDLRLDGFVDGRLVLCRSYSGSVTGDRIQIFSDDNKLEANGIDSTLITFRVVDRFGQPRPYATGDVQVTIRGPGVWEGQLSSLRFTIEPNVSVANESSRVTAILTNGAFPFEANGGVGGVLVKTIPGHCGVITVEVAHQSLGTDKIRIEAVSDACSMMESESAVTYNPDFTGGTLWLNGSTNWTVAGPSTISFSSVGVGSTASAVWAISKAQDAATGFLPPPTAVASFSVRGQPASTQTAIPLVLAITPIEAYNNVGITSNGTITDGGFDGLNNTYSAQALNAAGLWPGRTFTVDGLSFDWPDVPVGDPDNIIAAGQTLAISGAGSALGFIGAATAAPQGGIGSVIYIDGSLSKYTLIIGNYLYRAYGNTKVVATLPSYFNGTASTSDQRANYVFYASVPINASKTVQAVVLPSTGAAFGPVQSALHIFSISIE